MGYEILKTAIPILFEIILIIIIICVAYLAIRSVSGYLGNQKLGSVNYGGDIKKAVLGNAVEEMTMTTVRDSGGYIQNNNVLIEKHLKVFTPNFDAGHFNNFAVSLFERLVQTKGTEELPLISTNIKAEALPASIESVDGYYLHNYVIHNNTECLKLFCTIESEGEKEGYFLVFSRENPLIKLKDGHVLTVSCPHCGAEINMDQKLVSECPYCKNTVIFSEYDWILSEVEHVTPDTLICNIAMVKS